MDANYFLLKYISNLVGNAIKFRDQGEVVVDVAFAGAGEEGTGVQALG